MSFFHNIPALPEDPILSLPQAFTADKRPYKVNLGIGSYKTAEGLPLVLTAVRKAESILLQKNFNKEYLPIEGDSEFLEYGLKLLLGSVKIDPNQIFSCQSIGSTGALKLTAEFLAQHLCKNVFISQPAWINYKLIFENSGLNTGSYPYFNMSKHTIDFGGMCHAIKNMPAKSAIVLQASCHNPTGTDPSFEQWKELAYLIKKHRLIPIFDIAYHGICTDLEKDAECVRYFVQEHHEMFLCYSFAKNFGLYGERVGFLSVITNNPVMIPAIGSQIKTSVRSIYSTPPLHGIQIVKTILKSQELKMEWESELQNMRDRIKEMRDAFIALLQAKGSKEDYSYIKDQKGLFSMIGLTPEQVHFLRKEKAIFMPSNGRINIAGLNTKNMDYVVESLLQIL